MISGMNEDGSTIVRMRSSNMRVRLRSRVKVAVYLARALTFVKLSRGVFPVSR